MAKEQELINWMTDIQKNLSFKSKVQLIKEFWDNKDKFDQLKKDAQSWKDAYQIEKTKNQALDKKNTEKDDRIAQLDKLFKGTAVIFQKQHNYVDQLKKQLELEKQAKGISQEQANHLQADIDRLDKEKQELEQRKKELEEKRTETEKERDKELANLRAEKQQLENKLKQEELTYVEKKFLKDVDELLGLGSNVNLDNLPPVWNKVKNNDVTTISIKNGPAFKLLSIAKCLYSRMSEVEQEHQKQKTLTQQLKNIQDIDAQVYTILSQGSNENGLLPRTQAVIKELNKTRQNLANTNKQVSAWTTNYNTANSQLSLWTSTFPKENASQVQTRINNFNNQISSANTRANSLQTQLTTANAELTKEKGWWDKWTSDIDYSWTPHASSMANLNMSDVARNKIKDIAKIHAVDLVFFKQEQSSQTTSINFQGVRWGNISEAVSSNYSEVNAKKTINLLKAVAQYYRNK